MKTKIKKLTTKNYKLFILQSFSEGGQTKNGFTLIELLLVIAIIGILAGVLFVNMGAQRQRARAMAALQSVNSALPYVAECYLQNGTVNAPNAAGGNAICSIATGTTYPAIGTTPSTTSCSYTSGGGPGNNPIIVTCSAGTITCNYTTTVNCTKTGF